jgi:hypothetical protein
MLTVVSGSEPSAAFMFATGALLSAGAAHAEETDTVDTAVSTLIDAVKVVKSLAPLTHAFDYFLWIEGF